jgi:signal transduction histidine kinase/DNA-binding response OmpR family regulator
MGTRILSIVIDRDTDIIVARQRTRKIAQFLGFDDQDQTRITTAVSEIVRNALEYAKGGRIEYFLGGDLRQSLEINVMDKGPGIRDVNAVLEGRHRSATGMGVGVTGARKLMDEFSIVSAPGETTVQLVKFLPKRAPHVLPRELTKLANELVGDEHLDPIAEIRRQNQDILFQYQQLRGQQDELQELNQELQDTNRGVVALYAELEERADHLRRADQLKSRFLSNMSHEFRTPLNSILSLSRMLLSQLDGDLTAEQEKQVQFIRKAAQNLTELINDLLDLARIEAGKSVIAVKEFSIADLFGALRGMLRPLLVGDAVALNFNEGTSLPPMMSDEGKVSQILRNFISNAIKFTERGEVRITAAWDRDNDYVTFEVIDTGLGIAPQDLDVIWEEFGQAANPLQNKFKGTGLGLPLARRFAGLLGGSVGVDSELGKGSTFRVVVPRLYRALEPGMVPQEWSDVEGKVPVLLVEDNSADAFALERALAHSPYQVIVTSSIAEAKRALEHTNPAAVVLDVLLQGEESWRLLIELKQSEAHHHIPVIVLSASTEDRKARNFGADGYLDKPVDPATLIEQLDRLTGCRSVTKVLLVDDEEVSRYLIRQLLPRGAFKLIETMTGSEGLAAVEQDRPDIILFDLNMAEMSGFEFLERLNGAPAPPAIAITSMVLTEQHRARLHGAANVVSKFDLTTEVLVQAIRDALPESASA